MNLLNLPIPNMKPAKHAAELLTPIIESMWTRRAAHGLCSMVVDASLYDDVLPALTSGKKEEISHQEKWVCDPAALLYELRAILPDGFNIEFERDPVTGCFGQRHIYAIRYEPA